MSDDANPPAIPPPPAPTDGAPPAGASRPPSGDPRVHLYAATSSQRDRVIQAFDTQRAAVLKAVADQRAAAVAPIDAVRARQVHRSSGGPAAGAPAPGTAAGMGANAGGLTEMAALQHDMRAGRRAVAREVVAALRALIAHEVRAQLHAASIAAGAAHSDGAAASVPHGAIAKVPAEP